MKLEQQVCSLDLAKRLKEVGVKQESLFWWCNSADEPYEDFELLYIARAKSKYVWGKNGVRKYSAFTSSELGEMLPKRTSSVKTSDWTCEIVWRKIGANANTEANARAKMLVYLLETSLLDRKSVS